MDISGVPAHHRDAKGGRCCEYKTKWWEMSLTALLSTVKCGLLLTRSGHPWWHTMRGQNNWFTKTNPHVRTHLRHLILKGMSELTWPYYNRDLGEAIPDTYVLYRFHFLDETAEFRRFLTSFFLFWCVFDVELIGSYGIRTPIWICHIDSG